MNLSPVADSRPKWRRAGACAVALAFVLGIPSLGAAERGRSVAKKSPAPAPARAAQSAPSAQSGVPAISFSALLGGSDADSVRGMALDPAGNIYVVGETRSPDFRLSSAAAAQPPAPRGGSDVFVAKLAPGGAALRFIVFLGGSADDTAAGIAVAPDGSIVVAGSTFSADFPTQHPLQAACDAGANATTCTGDAFVAKLDAATGAILFSTYIGGSGDDAAQAVAISPTGSILIAGRTASLDFPAVNALHAARGGLEAFAAALTPDGAALEFSTYIGGSGDDQARAAVFAADGSAWIAGETRSSDFPSHSGGGSLQCASDSDGACSGDAFVIRIAPAASGPSLAYSVLLGGAGSDVANAIALDLGGNVIVAGATDSPDFPVVSPLPGQGTASAGNRAAFVARLAADGSGATHSTLLAGAGDDAALALAADALGNIYVAGHTASADFPLHRATQTQCSVDAATQECGSDAFLATINAAGTQLTFSTYLGASGAEHATALAASASGKIYVAGETRSPDFTTVPAGQLAPGAADGFLAALTGISSSSPPSVAPPDEQAVTACTGTIQWTNGAANNQWNVAGNWSTAAIPVATDDVCIPSAFAGSTITVGALAVANQSINSLITNAHISFTSGPLTVAGAATIDADLAISGGTLTLNGPSSVVGTFTHSGGTLGGSGTLTLLGSFTWSGGTQSGAGMTVANGPLSLTTTTRALNGRTLNTSSTVTWTAGRFDHGQGSVINNSGTWDVQADNSFLFLFGGTRGAFNNTGTFTKSAGAGTSTIDVNFTNASGGTLNANSGTLSVTADSTHASAINIAAGATLSFGGGSHNWNAGTGINGAGTLSISSSVSVNATVTAIAPISLFVFGTITGSATLNLNAPFTWAGGTMDGGGITNVNAGMSLTTTTHTLRNRTLNTSTAVTWTAGRFDHGQGAIINNTSTWTLQSDDDFLFTQGGTRGTFQNDGAFTKNPATGVTTFDLFFNNNAAGTVNASSGTLQFDIDTASAGAYNIAGTVHFNAGTHNWNAGVSFTGAGALQVSTTVNVNAALAINVPTTLLTSGVLTGAATLDFNVPFTWSGGTMDGGGITNVNAGMTLNTTTRTLRNRTLNTPTAVTWTAGRFDHGQGAIINNTSTWTLQSDDDFLFTQGGTRGVFNNTGTFTKAGGAGLTTFDVLLNLPATGVLDVSSGTLRLDFDSVSAGAFTVTTTLEFGAGTHNWNAGTTISGAGNVLLTTNVNANASITLAAAVQLSSGTLGGAGTLTLNGPFTWSGGTMDGGGVTTINGGMTLSTTTRSLRNRTLNTFSNVTWTAGRFDHGVGAIINNTSTWTLQSDDDFLFTQGGTRGVFNNNGTFTKAAGAGLSTFDMTLNHNAAGVFNVNTGTLRFDFNSTNAGDFNVAAVLDFNTGTHNFNSGSSISGAGSTILGATENFNPGSTITTPVTINGGVASFLTGAVVMLPTLTLTSGTLSGTDQVDITGLFTWSGGSQDGGGVTNAPGGMLLNVTTRNIRNRTLNTPAAVTWTAGRFDHGQGAVINNTGVWDLQSDDDFLFTQGGTRGIFNNNGTFIKSAGTGLSTFDMTLNQSASGVIHANSGTLRFDFDSTAVGAFNVAATLDFNTGTHNLNSGAMISGSGTLLVSTTVNVNAGAVINLPVTLTGGTLSWFSGALVNMPSLTQTAGTFAGTDTVNIAGVFNWSGGTQTGAGITNANGGWNLTGGVNLTAGRILNNAAAGVVSASGFMNIGTGAVLNNLAGATLDLQNNQRLGGGIGGAEAINNSGMITRSTAVGTFSLFSPFHNNGTVSVTSGTLNAIGGGNCGSVCSGAFTVAAGATLSFGGGTFDLGAASSVTGAGTVDFGATVNHAGLYDVMTATRVTGGTTNLTGTVNNLSALTISSGTLNLNKSAPAGPLTVPTLTQTAGTLSGADTLNITGLFAWSGGSHTGGGTTNANGGWNLTGGVNLVSGRTLNNAAAAVVSASGFMNIGTGAVLNNLAGATLDLQNNLRLGGGIGGVEIINNAGAITRSTSALTFTIHSTFNNSGVVNVNTGTLSLSTVGSSTHTGAFNVASGATLFFSSGAHDLNAGASITGAGLTFFSATENFNAGSSLSTAVNINAGTLTLATGSTVTLPTLTQSGGVLQGAGTLDVTGVFDWSGGTHTGSGTTNANGGWNLTGGVNLAGGRIFNNVTVGVVSSFGFMNIGTGAVLNNLVGATLDLQNNIRLGAGLGGVEIINNAGTITRSTATGTFSIHSTFNNTGVVNVNTGTLSLGTVGTSTHTGAFNVASGATLFFSSGAHDLNAGASITGAGLTFFSAIENFNAGSSLTTAVTMNAGILTLATGSTVTLPTLTQSGGVLQGTGTLDITGVFDWSGGTHDGAGTTNANGGWNLTGGVTITNGRVFNNVAVGVVSAFGFMNIGSGAVLNNPAGATLDLQNNLRLGAGIGGVEIINNAGTITRSTATGTFSIHSAFNNTGAVFVNAGTLSLNTVASSAHTGTFNVAAGTTLFFASGAHDLNSGASITGAGLTFFSATENFNAGSSLTTAVTMNGGTLTLATGSPVTLPAFTQSGGVLQGPDTLNISGLFDWLGGSHDGAATTNANGGWNLTGGVTITNGRVFNNAASGVVSSFGFMNIGSGAVLNNLAGATLDIRNDFRLGGGIGGAETINNMGVVLRTASAGNFQIFSAFNNTGTLSINTGSLQFFSSFTQTAGVTRATGGSIFAGTMTIAGGLLEGNAPGSINATVNNTGGILSPGLSPGTLSLNGSYVQAAGAAMTVEIGGTLVGSQFDRFNVGGSATLAGTLNVALVSGFTPSAGHSFAVMTFGSRTGTFAATNLPALGGGLVWNVIYGATSVILQVQPAMACTINFDNSNANNQWQDPLNWDTNVLPGPTDRACIGMGFNVNLSSGAHTIDQFYSDSPLTLSGGSLTITGASGISSANSSFTQTGGTLDGAGALSIAGLFSWTGGVQQGAGSTTSNGGAQINAPVTLRARAISFSLNTTVSGNINHGQGAVINVPAGSNFSLAGDISLNFTEGGAATTFNNAGAFTKILSTMTSSIAVNFTSTGLVNPNSGTMDFVNGYTQSGPASTLLFNGGAVSSAGAFNINGGVVLGVNPAAGVAITANVNNSGGVFAPGMNSGIGTLGIMGNYTQGAGGTLAVELAGPNAGQFDVLAVSGAATLAGTLDVMPLGAFTPAANNMFNVMTYSSATGDFTTKNGLVISGRILTATANATAYVLTAVATADVSVSKVATPNPVGTGNTLTYTITVSNAGPDPAAGVTLTDALPAAVNFVSVMTTQGSCSGTSTVTCNIGTLASSANATVTIQVTTTGPGMLSNTATVTSTANDPNNANNSSTIATTVSPATFLGPTPYTCQNNSPFFAAIMAGTVVLETFEDGLFNVPGVTANFGSVIAPGGLTDSVDCDDGLIDGSGAAGRSFFSGSGATGITFTFNSAALGGFPTQVGIVWTDGSGTITFEAFDALGNSLGVISGNHADGNFGGTTGEDRFYGVTHGGGISAIRIANTAGGIEVDHLQYGPVGGATVDLAITKMDTPDPVTQGSNLTYTLTVTNSSATAATGVVLTDALPAGVAFVSATPTQGSCSGTSTVTCNLGSIASMANAGVTIVVTPGAGAVPSITNTATVASAEADSNTANNTASATTSVNPLLVDLTLSKTDSPDPVSAGANLTYTLTVTNVSANTATSVVLTDTLPANVAFVSATPTQGACGGTTTVTCNLGTLAGSAVATVTIVVTPSAAAVPSITNNASVTSAQTEATPGDNSASATTTVLAANVDLMVALTDSPDPVNVGATLTYSLSVTNAGPDIATSVVLTNTLPATVVFQSATPSQGTCSRAGVTVTCTLGTLAVAGNATVSIVVTPGASAAPSITNNASVTSAQTETNAADNTASATTTVNPLADLALAKTDSPDPVGTTSSLTYTVTVTNNGPSPATGVTVTDTLPAGVTFSSASAGCVHNAGVVSCALGTVSAGAVVPLNIVVTTGGVGMLTNTASVTANEPDPNAANNSATATTSVVSGPAISLSTTSLVFASQPVGIASPPQAFSIQNTGNSPLSISAITAGGDFAQTSTCGASLAAGATCFVTVTFTPSTTGFISGNVTITHNAPGSPATVTVSGAGVLAPSISLTALSVVYGTQLINTTSVSQIVTLTNNGSATLNLTAIAATGDFAQTNNCGSSVAAGASCTITITFTPTATGIRTGAVTITSNAPGSPPVITLTGIGVSPGVTISTSLLVFPGQAIGTTSAAQNVTLANTGTAAISITSIIATGNFAQTNNCGATLAAAANCVISVTFSPAQAGPLSGLLTITDSGVGSPRVVGLSGTGLAAALTLSPLSLTFPNQPVGTTSGSLALTVTNTGGVTVTIGAITVAGNFAQTNNCPASLAPAANCVVNVTFAPQASGLLTGSLSIANSTATNPQVAMLLGTGVASGAAAALSATQLTFTQEIVGATSAPQMVTLTNTGNAVMNITSIATTGDFAAAHNCGAMLAAAANCAITVTFSPTAAGNRAGTLSVTSDASGSPHSVALSGSAFPAGPNLSLATLQVNFGTVIVGQTSTSQSVTLSNTGNAALNITSIAASGDFAATHNCGASLAAGANCAISVTFTPTTTGARSGAVTITHSAPGSPHSISLAGSGSSFALSVAGNSTVSMPAGQTASFTLALTPAGGFNELVTVTCTGAPAGSTCTATPSSLTLTTAVNVTISVNTFAARAAAAPPAPGEPHTAAQPALAGVWNLEFEIRNLAVEWQVGLLAIAALLMLFVGFVRAARQRARLAPRFAAAAALLLAVLCVSCAGGLGVPPPVAGGGTAPGTYTLTVNATSSSGIVRTTTLTMTVQ